MKFKLLLLFILITSILTKAQEPYQNLIFSEVRMDQAHHAYFEITNMGSISVDLAQFEFGNISPWNDPYIPGENQSFRFPAHMLNPGESYVVAIVRDWGDEQALLDPEVQGSNTKDDTWRLADLQLHAQESPTSDPTDSVSPGYSALVVWGGTYCYYLRHHYIEGDSVVTDAVNGVFTGADGRRPGNYGPSDVAGVPDATINSILVRKYSIKTGNLDWEAARGVDITDSEWLPVPTLSGTGWEMGRKEFWTMGNHGDYKLQESLSSETIDIDWNTNTLTIKWGARNQDSLMNEFNHVPGLAWKYQMSPSKLDSAYTSVRTGDSVTIYACGNQLESVKFGIVALAPTASETRVIPKNSNNGGGWFTPYIVSENLPNMDTISEVAYATRVDSLLKYLEKPDAANWQILWADGTERPDLIDGDILKVTAENGSATKEYYIKVEDYIPSHDASLSSITWPDIPDFYKGIYGWLGDTIPNFSPSKYNYNVQVPWDVEGIPALVAKPTNPDTKISVERATSLYGSEAAKTVKFYTTAEDDTTFLTYSVRFEKEKDLSNVQPYNAEPFISQFVFRPGWRGLYIEICNPGNQPLDLSHYCIVRSAETDPYQAITTSSGLDNWAGRFNRYVPGYIWQDEAEWQVQPGILVPDLAVNTIIEPGDVFVMANAFPNDQDNASYLYPAFNQVDVNFNNDHNPWGITFADEYSNICGGWFNSDWILYKILNDSILNGTKPLIDPYDVEVIDVLGHCDGNGLQGLMIADPETSYNQNSGMIRLPQYYKGNPLPGGSYLDTVTNKPSEWFYTNEAYWLGLDYNWLDARAMLSNGIGSHELNTITEFISTVSSAAYAVSDGYDLNQTIGGGVKEGITVAEFLQNLIYLEDQTLTITANGAELTEADVLTDGAVLKVVSPNGDNTTAYTISVTAEGLDDNALLTSAVYTITVDGSMGTVTGFEAGTTLKEVYSNVTPPANASLFGAFLADGSYASFTQMKYDTTYVDVLASDEVYFEVIAQDGKTRINYQLLPNSTSSDAYVLSSVFDIDQDASLIALIPDGINVTALMSYLTPAPGATMIITNKMDQVRENGTVYKDDKLVVTAQDGVTQKVYSLELFSQFEARYEAQLGSEVWTVIQATKKINGVRSTTSVEEFLDAIYVSMGATYVLLDASGNPVTTGSMNDNFTVVVTSENGLVVNTYKVVIDRTGVISFDNSTIKAYPNPTTGMITIDGINEGNLIRIFDAMGRNVRSLTASSDREVTSLESQPSGIYMVIVSNGTQHVAQFKMIKK